jgi:hypothetical protein
MEMLAEQSQLLLAKADRPPDMLHEAGQLLLADWIWGEFGGWLFKVGEVCFVEFVVVEAEKGEEEDGCILG